MPHTTRSVCKIKYLCQNKLFCYYLLWACHSRFYIPELCFVDVLKICKDLLPIMWICCRHLTYNYDLPQFDTSEMRSKWIVIGVMGSVSPQPP